MFEVDSAWFEKMIAQSGYSKRGLGRLIKNRLGNPVGHGIIVKMINGERTIQLHEARQLADLFGCPMSEVIRRAGIPFGKRDNL